MHITKLDAAKSQLATAIWLYFEDRDPVSVHTLATAAGEIIDRLCDAKGVLSMREDLLAKIVPNRRKEIVDALNEARNFFKHASSSKPNQVIHDFDDERNLYVIIFAEDGMRLLGVDMPEGKIFRAWVSIVEPQLMLVQLPQEPIFGDIVNLPRSAQKKTGRDALSFALSGKLPS